MHPLAHLPPRRQGLSLRRTALGLLVVLLVGLAGLAGALGPAGCHTDRQICTDLCNRYQQCVDPSYDVESCQARCTDHASEGTLFSHQVESCNACSEGRQCSVAFANCLTACSGVLP